MPRPFPVTARPGFLPALDHRAGGQRLGLAEAVAVAAAEHFVADHQAVAGERALLGEVLRVDVDQLDDPIRIGEPATPYGVRSITNGSGSVAVFGDTTIVCSFTPSRINSICSVAV